MDGKWTGTEKEQERNRKGTGKGQEMPRKNAEAVIGGNNGNRE